ncbi:MAG: TonB-dependent receptor [Paludibacter sp.]|nr:TonB-dependent receptor [Paludibacter sp.]
MMQLKLRFQRGDFFPFKKNFVLLLFLAVSLGAFAQNELSGKVIDKNGDPIIGASIKVKGTNSGTITDVSGFFKLNVNGKESLLISYIGYQTQEVSIKGKSSVMVQLAEDDKSLDEVVVVGYGTQPKKSLTGAVAQVSGAQAINGKSSTNVAEDLQGVIPGLTVTRTSSRPGNEGLVLKLRGDISVNAVSPMILIDGLVADQAEFAQINPDDIETISVLKDASASIYGTRAAGGVILITTKRGKVGKVQINYSGSYHVNDISHRFPIANANQFGQMNEQAATNDAVATGSPAYWIGWQKSVIDGIISGSPSTPWGVTGLHLNPSDPTADQFNDVYGDTSGQDHSITISGGNDKLKANTSISYSSDRSLEKVVFDGTKKYTFRTNADYQINKWATTQFNISYDNRLVSTPTNGVGQGVQDPFIFPLYNPLGEYYDQFGYNNILAKLTEGGTTNTTTQYLRMGGNLKIDLGFLLKGLSINGNIGIKSQNYWLSQTNNQITMYDWTGNITFQTTPSSTNIADTYQTNVYKTYGAFVNYLRSFNDHNISLMTGLTTEDNRYQQLYGKRTTMASTTLIDLNTGSASTATNAGGSNEWGLVSYIARANYNYKGIYLLEASGRRDGSSKLASDYRWKDFGGLTVGVRLSEMSFIKDLVIFDNLKIRGGYGETGSISGIGNYDYISGISTGTTVFGPTGALSNTAWVTSMTTDKRSWERVGNSNIGLDFSVLNNRLDGTVDVYHRENRDMLIQVVYPAILGATSPYTNSGDFNTDGWEMAFNWRDKIGKDFNYNIGVSLANSQSIVTSYPAKVAIAAGANSIVQGKPLNAIYVYRTDGYLQTQAAVDAYYPTVNASGSIIPLQTSTNRLTPGCVKIKDLNGDGKITTADLSYYGDANPHYTFGINLGAGFKGFDFSSFLQGVGQQNVLRTGYLAYPWAAPWTNQNSTFLGNTWTANNPNAEFPVMSTNGSRNTWNYKYNDINVVNCQYIRVKSIVLGYTLPMSVIKKLNIDKLRIYASGNDLFTLSNVKDGFDPESQAAASQGNVDVFARTITFGVDLTF